MEYGSHPPTWGTPHGGAPSATMKTVRSLQSDRATVHILGERAPGTWTQRTEGAKLATPLLKLRLSYLGHPWKVGLPFVSRNKGSLSFLFTALFWASASISRVHHDQSCTLLCYCPTLHSLLHPLSSLLGDIPFVPDPT